MQHNAILVRVQKDVKQGGNLDAESSPFFQAMVDGYVGTVYKSSDQIQCRNWLPVAQQSSNLRERQRRGRKTRHSCSQAYSVLLYINTDQITIGLSASLCLLRSSR